MSGTVFSKNLRKLREEKKIAQKSAASSLGVSQALLSHYEKGIRECGLDFLGRAAKFYGVSSDSMLGIDNNNIYIKEENKTEITGIAEKKPGDCVLKKDGAEYNISAALYKNLLINAISYIFDDMKDMKRKELSVLSGKYIASSIYALCVMLYGGIGEKSPKPLGDYDGGNAYINNIIAGATPRGGI
ncbi:MAG: helix-turn-helix domain-containing protein [Oscillospiraceae bacterium]|nr:helix-turn-helix domain-containing protein [Oscillospiraceae bacterium]